MEIVWYELFIQDGAYSAFETFSVRKTLLDIDVNELLAGISFEVIITADEIRSLPEGAAMKLFDAYQPEDKDDDTFEPKWRFVQALVSAVSAIETAAETETVDGETVE